MRSILTLGPTFTHIGTGTKLYSEWQSGMFFETQCILVCEQWSDADCACVNAHDVHRVWG